MAASRCCRSGARNQAEGDRSISVAVDPGWSTAIPDRPDRCSRPARTKAAAIVPAAVKAGPPEIVPVAVISIITRDRVNVPRAPVAARDAWARSSLSIWRKAVT